MRINIEMISLKKFENFRPSCDRKSCLKIGQLLGRVSPLFPSGTLWNLRQHVHQGFPNKYSANLIILILKRIFAVVLFLTLLLRVNNISSIGKMADAQGCVLRQYTIQVNKLIDFDIYRFLMGSNVQSSITFLFMNGF